MGIADEAIMNGSSTAKKSNADCKHKNDPRNGVFCVAEEG
jgi:hypothetical protein